jgi:hypothetical protein
MSLTSILDDSTTSLRQFLARVLPDVSEVRLAYRAVKPSPLDVVRPVRPEGGRPAWGTLGAAINHRLGYALSDKVNRTGSISGGVRLSGRVARPAAVAQAVQAAGSDLLTEMERLVAEHRPFDRSQPAFRGEEAEDQLARVCYAAALYEEIYRTGQLWPGTPLGDARADFDVEKLLAMVPEYAVADIAAVVSLAVGGLEPVRASTTPEEVIIGPTFAGSLDVGGADADWIAAGLLVDVKAAVQPGKFDTRTIYQLIGYALLDYDNRHKIDQLGLYQARAGWLTTWNLDVYLGLLGTSRLIADLRAEVAELFHREPEP